MDRHKKRELQRESYARVRREIVAERGATLARITRTLERQLERLQHMHDGMPAVAASKRAKHVAAYNALRRKADTYRWYLRVQREVNGLYDGDTLDERYPLPEPMAE